MYILLFIIAIIVWILGYIIFKKQEQIHSSKRVKDLIFLHIKIQKKSKEDKTDTPQNETFRDNIWLMEQLLASLRSLYSPEFKHRLFGQDNFSFEYISSWAEITFQMAIPKKTKWIVEKQITWFYPDAIIEEANEIDIFKWKKAFSTSYIYTWKDYVYPIKTYKALESDPINNIINTISWLWDKESAWIQILLKPTLNGWQHTASKQAKLLTKWKKFSFIKLLNPIAWIRWFFNIFTASIDSSDNNNTSNEKTNLESEIINMIDEKWKKVWYNIIIRLVATWESTFETDSQIQSMLSSFTQFSSPNTNRFHISKYHSHSLMKKAFKSRSFDKPFLLQFNTMILNTEELASIYHFPNSNYNKSEEIKWQRFKIVKAPTNVPKEWLLIWTNEYRWEIKEIRMKESDRLRHFYIIWQTWTWKSSTLSYLARQDLRLWNWIAVMDPHGDLAKWLLPFVPRERADDIIYFNPADLSRPMWLNMIEADWDDEKQSVVQDALSIMIKLFWNEIFWPRIQDYFRNGVLTLMDYPHGAAITDIMRLFTDDAFQKERLSSLKNPIVKAWWEWTYKQQWDREKKEIIPFMAAKFWWFITDTLMRNIIWQTESAFNVREVMDSGKILLINLSKWILWDFNSNMLWLILVSRIQMAAMSRQNIDEEDRNPFYLYIDEFQNYVTDSIESILSEARKYKLWLTIAHQYIWQLEKSDALTKSNLNLKWAIFWNVWTIMSYKIWPDDWEFLEKQFAPNFTSADLVNMDKYKSIMRLAIDTQPSPAFSVTPWNPYLEKWDKELAKAYIELSRLKYWKDRKFIEKDINFRIWVT